jgi:hypothetical protein
MDPLSITAAVVSFLSFSGSCAKHLRRLIHAANHAPDEILAMSNEISDINLILNDIENTNRTIETSGAQGQASPDLNSALSEQLVIARSKIVQLEALSSKLFIRLPNGTMEFQRYAWVRKRSKAISSQRDLRKVKRSLDLLLSSATA